MIQVLQGFFNQLIPIYFIPFDSIVSEIILISFQVPHCRFIEI